VSENGAVTKKSSRLSPEARDKLSRLAKERHAEGRFGGSEFGKLGGRPRKDRAAKRVAEAAQEDENARKIIKVFQQAVAEINPVTGNANPMSIRLKAAEAWLSAEREEAKVSLQEQAEDSKQHSREELLAMMAEKLTSGPTSNILRRQIETETGVVDATVVEE
jgi:hypothetical protein